MSRIKEGISIQVEVEEVEEEGEIEERL